MRETVTAPSSRAPAIEVRGLRKEYRGLRPLRLERLVIAQGERVAIMGLDALSAEVLVNIVSAAVLPDEGEVWIFGESTGAIPTADAWLQSLDRLGIVTPRAVLPDGLSLAQNLALPFTLTIDPVPATIAATVARLADEVGLPPGSLERPSGELDAETRVRAHVARALAFDPRLLLLEHPTATLPRGRVECVAADLIQITRRRELAVLALTADEAFARALVDRPLMLDPARGTLAARGGLWTRWRRVCPS